MNSQEIQTIQQRLMEGYYEADADTLLAMQALVDMVKRLQEQDDHGAPDEIA